MLFTPLILLLAGSVVATVEVPRAFNGSSTVTTSSGLVSGHPASNISTVTEYLGISYTQPPTGSLRFRLPQTYNGTAPINAESFGFSCPQGTGLTQKFAVVPDIVTTSFTPTTAELLTLVGGNTEPIGEDCLTLNIWVPSGGETTKAVMIFIHVGRFTIGSSNVPIYNGQIFANEQDVIVVTMNYRLAIFDFPGNPKVAEKNVGLLDQRMTVEWVRDNIAGFGGDTRRMVLQGQSAGSASTNLYSYAYADDPIVQGFITESGVMSLAVGGGGTRLPGGSPPSSPASNSSEGWFNASSALGCGDSTSDPNSFLTCMQSINMTSAQVKAAVAHV